MREVHAPAQAGVTTGLTPMLKNYLTVPIIVMGALLATPSLAQDLGDHPSHHDPRLGPKREFEVRPRGQRDQVAPPDDGYSTEEPDDDDDLDVEDLDNAPSVDHRL